MRREYRHRILLLWMSILGLVLLTACTKDDDGDKSLPMVKAQFNFSLPMRSASAQTRMSGDVVQEDGSQDHFRGLTDVNLFCYKEAPTQTTTKIGGIIDISSSDSEETTDVTTDYSMCQEINIPVTTKYFGFYARANDSPTTHQDKMKYGIVETVGMTKGRYQDNSSIRFRPVSICTSDAPLGGDSRGLALLALLNDLMSTTVNVAAPNDKWSTANNLYLNEAYKRMTQLKALSSNHVQLMLAAVNRMMYQLIEPDELLIPDDQGRKLAQAIVSKIASVCTAVPAADAATIELIDDYQNFPTNIGLPEGAARIEWNAEQGKFVVPDSHTYGSAINISKLTDYAYPMNLQYQVLSTILASDNLVIQSGSHYTNWENMLETGYAGARDHVEESTQSIAMVDQVQYAVGRMVLKTRISTDAVSDANNQYVDTDDGFTLKGYIIGGQREVDFDFKPVEGSDTYAIYDSYLSNGTSQEVAKGTFKNLDYILGLGTNSNQKINIALELVNDCADFQGADGVIAHGATFYLMAELDPNPNNDESAVLNKIFDRDYYTTVYLTITSLAKATYGLPNLDVPHPTLGVSVNLSWEEGLWFDDVVLSRYAE